MKNSNHDNVDEGHRMQQLYTKFGFFTYQIKLAISKNKGENLTNQRKGPRQEKIPLQHLSYASYPTYSEPKTLYTQRQAG